MRTLLLLFFISNTFNVLSQNTFKNQFSAENIEAVFVSNISGHINVKAHRSSTIELKQDIIKSSRDYKVFTEVYNDTLIIVVAENDYSLDQCDFTQSFPGNINQSKCNSGAKQLTVDLELLIPENISLKVSTINDGDITISNVVKAITALNINGSIDLNGVTQVNKARTINGDVKIIYKSNPQKEGEFYSLNGDIEMSLKRGIHSNFTFKSFNGDFYSNYDKITLLPTPWEKEKRNGKTLIKKDKKSIMQIGNGGFIMAFETFNGDAIVNIN